MFKQFLHLQWKSFFRSSNLGKGLALKILMGFFAIYMLVSLAGAGTGLYFVLRKIFPDQSPIWVLSGFLAYWLFAELLLRYFMQKLPVMDIKPFLVLPIKKGAIAHYILGRSGLSIYNLLSLFFFVPFAVVLILHGHPALHVVLWVLGLFAITLCLNYTNLLINKSDKALLVIAGGFAVLYALNYFEVLSIRAFFAPIFHALYAYPITVLIPWVLATLAYYINYRYLRKRVYLDASLKTRTKEAKVTDLGWTKRFGDLAPFLQLDLKLIWRNKRTRTQAIISVLFVFYGLIFYTMGDYGPDSPMMVFVGIFITGIFLTNFGQFIPAWDSAYYSMMMSQNIPLRQYLESKALLISVSIGVMFLLSIPYIYFGWQAVAINLATALYNLGINIPMILFLGSFNKKRIDLDQSPFGNMQGTSAVQFLIMLPVLVFPILLYVLLNWLVSFEAALVALSLLGLLGFAFRNKLLDAITGQYRKKKYGMVAGFKEKNG